MASIADMLLQAAQCHQAGQLPAAEALCRQALHRDPSQAEAWHLLGLMASQTGRYEEAVDYLSKALTGQADNPACHANLGIAYQQLGKLHEAVACYREALRLFPAFPEVLSNLGYALRMLGRCQEAIDCCQQALRLKPAFPDALNNLGNAQADLGIRDEAVVSFREALRFQPGFADVHNNLGTVLGVQGKLDEALAHFREALRLQPGFADAHNNLGTNLTSRGKLDDALVSFREALRLQPDFSKAHSNLLFGLNYHPQIEPAALFAEHRQWDALHGQPALALPAPGNDRNPDRPLRIGYVSPDFRAHPVARFLEPILAHHDATQFKSICYAQVASSDVVTARLKSIAGGWCSTVGLSDAEVADQIRRDGIDILVDLAGHTADNRLPVFTYKPAPVQVTYLGYPNTTGLSTIDYRLTDTVADPSDEPTLYSEQLVRLPGCFCCYQPPADVPEPGPLPADAAGRITLGSLHNLIRLNTEVLDLWSAVLRALPTARLLLYRNSLTGETREHFRRQLAERGIGDDRLLLRHAPPTGQRHWSVYQDIDISLDTFPWSGHTTACESLWMGVPVVTMYGDRFASRMAASVLTCLGMTDWIAESPEQYIALAVQHANARDRLRVLRASLRATMTASALCDGNRFTRSLEETYRQMWRTWLAGEMKGPRS